jgi:hypothetical protein
VNHVGSAAEEAARLFAAMEDWARQKTGHLLDDEHVATGSPECSMCPVCQGIGAIRHVRPEAVEHFLDAAASFVAALKVAVTTPPPEPGPPRERVQHIDIGEA